jgi:hypothetical protein
MGARERLQARARAPKQPKQPSFGCAVVVLACFVTLVVLALWVLARETWPFGTDAAPPWRSRSGSGVTIGYMTEPAWATPMLVRGGNSSSNSADSFVIGRSERDGD